MKETERDRIKEREGRREGKRGERLETFIEKDEYRILKSVGKREEKEREGRSEEKRAERLEEREDT